jgi:hypothetical protein
MSAEIRAQIAAQDAPGTRRSALCASLAGGNKENLISPIPRAGIACKTAIISKLLKTILHPNRWRTSVSPIRRGRVVAPDAACN